MKVIKKIGKGICIALAAVLALALLVVGGLNVAKFFIYSDYYEMHDNLCVNPGLGDGFVCQGIAVADAQDVILVSGYMKGDEPSRIYVTTLDNNSHYVDLFSEGEMFDGHAGGISVTGGVVYIASGSKIYSCSLDTILQADSGTDVEIGSGVEINNNASFLYSDDEYLYVGTFYNEHYSTKDEHIFETAEGTHYAICTQYAVGDLTTPVAIYSIRDQVQGICFTPDGDVVMSTSYGLADSYYYVYELEDAVDSGKTLDGAPVYFLDSVDDVIKGPAMAEGLDYYKGQVITLTESASDKYIYGKLFFAYYIVGLEID